MRKLHHKKFKISLILILLALTSLGTVSAQQIIRTQTPPNETNMFHYVRWSPYIVGAAIGILVILTFWISNEAIGVSGAFARTAGMIEKIFRGDKVEQKEYYKKQPPKINWEWLFVIGLMIGSFTSAKLSGDFKLVIVPQTWLQAAGNSGILRWLFAFIGAIIMGFGARWARGCTSGHGISGTLQLAVSSWIATLALFLSGIITAMFLYNVIL